MSVGLFLRGVTNPAVLLSVFRGGASVALVPLVLNEKWTAAVYVLLAAALSDSGDGIFARMRVFRHPWNGKGLNDFMSFLLSVSAPGSITLWLALNHPDSDSFWHSGWLWSWVGACVFFVLGTLWFNSLKNSKHSLDDRVRAEVSQGWFYGLILLVSGAQLFYLAAGTDEPSQWLFFVAVVACLTLAAKHRWIDRPEVRAAEVLKKSRRP